MTPYKTAIILIVVFVLALFGAIYLDWWVTMGKAKDRSGDSHSEGKTITYAAPKPSTSVIRFGPDNEPYAMKGREWKRWKEPEAHSCIPGADPPKSKAARSASGFSVLSLLSSLSESMNKYPASLHPLEKIEWMMRRWQRHDGLLHWSPDNHPMIFRICEAAVKEIDAALAKGATP